MIALTFNRVFAHREISVSKSYVHRVLREQAHAVWLARRAMPSAKPRDCPINHCWALDLTGRADASGTVHQILGVVDHGSRRLLMLNAITRKCGWKLLGHLRLAIAEYGKPRFVRTDNERCFTGSVFVTGLKLLGIKHQRIDLHCPWQNGRIERLFGTLKDKLRQIVLADGKAITCFCATSGVSTTKSGRIRTCRGERRWKPGTTSIRFMHRVNRGRFDSWRAGAGR